MADIRNTPSAVDRVSKTIRLPSLLLLLISVPPGAAAAEFYAWAGVETYEGTYGGTERVRDTYWYVNPIWRFESTQLSLYVPYVRVEYPGTGAVQRGPDGRILGTDSGASGLGDITASAWYELSAPQGVLVGGSVKLPTAEDPTLGTGEPDYSLMLDLYRPVGRGYLTAGAAYTFYGDPDEYDYADLYSGYIGAEWYAAWGFVGGSLYAEEPWEPGLPGARELNLFLGRPLGSRTVWVSFTHGLSETSPDWGVGIAISLF